MKTGFISVGAALIITALAGFATSATAARMPDQPHDWSGLYAGVTAGYAWGNSEHCDTSAFCTHSFDVNGITGGGTVGYNWQPDASFVAGLETDLSGANARGSTKSVLGVFGCGLPDNCHTDLNWFGTLRGRLGYAGWNNWLPFVTGGLAYGELTAGLGGTPPFGTQTDGVELGWTVGGGVEYALLENWSAKFEYQHLEFSDLFYDTAHLCGSRSCTALSNSFNLVRMGVNYRF